MPPAAGFERKLANAAKGPKAPLAAAAIGQSGYQALVFKVPGKSSSPRMGLSGSWLKVQKVAGQGYWQKYFEAMKPPWRVVKTRTANHRHRHRLRIIIIIIIIISITIMFVIVAIIIIIIIVIIIIIIIIIITKNNGVAIITIATTITIIIIINNNHNNSIATITIAIAIIIITIIIITTTIIDNGSSIVVIIIIIVIGFSTGLAATVPSLCVSAFAQAFARYPPIDQVRELAKKTFPNVAMLRHLATTKGISSWFTGLDAAILKTAPKYMVAVIIKDYMGQWLAPVDPKEMFKTEDAWTRYPYLEVHG
ncbi:hypothetical protein AK812_SmicGene10278 [Symbiodinium microadriaticum]|uniref:Uncharacterized protein n=1 Tax=Symbiodinium microadriaticum TaxID=2951 RepID=A0A1Q9EG87_SYMMI|nr:hypothetical protein AK812_SmicGene10278 [Symbiodinium microadriaticum]